MQKDYSLLKNFIIDLVLELVAMNQKQVSADKIFKMTKNILNFMEEDASDDYETNQHILGISELFYSHVIKVQHRVDFSQDKYSILNHIVTKYCVLYYTKYQKDRNKFYHDKEEEKEKSTRMEKKDRKEHQKK